MSTRYIKVCDYCKKEHEFTIDPIGQVISGNDSIKYLEIREGPVTRIMLDLCEECLKTLVNQFEPHDSTARTVAKGR